MNVAETVAYLTLNTTLLTTNDRWDLQRALDTCPPADEAAARRLLENRVRQWVGRFRSVHMDTLSGHAAWENGLEFDFTGDDHRKYVEQECAEEYAAWCADNEEAPETGHEGYVRSECETAYEEWCDSNRDIVWNTLFTTDSELIARAMFDTGCVVFDGTPFDLDRYVIGFGGAGYSFYGSHWIPAYLEVVYGEREFFTIDGKLVSYRDL